MIGLSGFMIGMQAAGMVANLYGTRQQQRLIQQGRALEKSAIEANLEALNYEYQESSLEAMKSLRANLGTQAVMAAASGNTASEATAVRTQKSVNAFNSDERNRRMNLLAREANLRASNVLSGLHTLQAETQLGRSMLQSLESLPISSSIDSFRRSDLGKKWGFGYSKTAAKQKNYGLNAVGE